uniref:Putative integral membrane protein n=1 Tax=Streptomyces sp. 14R-10 TaxID=1442159 RepID=W0FTM2_9ACTN|nr:hypothetical protein [Streptomyces sp. 14R-10]AHF46185.1 putative integral membrane protein [Streptomyces sp. 14R-10]
MQPSGDFTTLMDALDGFLKWVNYIGLGVGGLMVTTGIFRQALGNQAGDTLRAHRGVRLITNGAFVVVATAAPRLFILMTSDAPGEDGGEPAPGGDDFDIAPFLLWGGASLGALALAALAGLGGLRLWRDRRAKRRRRQALERSHDTIATSYTVDYLGDVLEWLERPTLADVSVPETAALVQALAAADDARLGDDLDRYQQAVAALGTAWQAADDRARRTGLRDLPAAEQRAAEQARKLLVLALDDGGSERERRAAYGKARSLLDGILVVPPQALRVLEDDQRLALPRKSL